MFQEGGAPSAATFRWAVGIENTFVPHTRAGHRRLDEYELMDHYRLWRQDIDLAADLGISTIRYGIPWYRVNPRPGHFDWSWTDQVIEYLVGIKRLTPIIDLMHYGTPLWLDNGFVNASYPRRVAEYASRFAERYAGMVRCYTPLNEPSVTAAYCGRDGRWPPYLSGDDGYVKVLLSLCRGMVATAAALLGPPRCGAGPRRGCRARAARLDRPRRRRAAGPGASATAAGPGLRPRHARPCPVSLAAGARADGHRAGGAGRFGRRLGCARRELLPLDEPPAGPPPRRTRVRVACDSPPSGLAEVLHLVHSRYGRPVMVTETSSTGTHMERAVWMRETLAAVRQARAGRVPVVGYTWFPLFTMIEWKYRWLREGLDHHLLHLGLFDVRSLAAGRMDREPTPLVEGYRGHIAEPAAVIGEWSDPVAIPPATPNSLVA